MKMKDLARLNLAESSLLFGEGSGHVPVQLMRLRNPLMLWTNWPEAAYDTNFQARTDQQMDYEQYLLKACSYVIPADLSSEDLHTEDILTGYVDRYGGPGIGANGGSGRAVLINGYLVKGAGRTPLVSHLTDLAHGSGGAYLEESVRESIFSEIVRAEFPSSAVPVLGIIDTGLVQVWQEKDRVKIERRVLLVRPCFVRPAHYMRAIAFISSDPNEGSQDTKRVKRMFQSSLLLSTKKDFLYQQREFWLSWAKQLAYSFMHRLPFGSNTMSNICLDGKLVDFGAISSVPTWANIATMRGFEPFGFHMNTLREGMQSMSYYIDRYVGSALVDNMDMETILAAVQQEYKVTCVRELLRQCGLTRSLANAVLKTDMRKDIWKALISLVGHFQAERLDFIAEIQPVQRHWDLDLVWSKGPPRHMQELSTILCRLIPETEHHQAMRRARWFGQGRDQLNRESMKKTIFAALDSSASGQAPDAERVSRYIYKNIAMGRRDYWLDDNDVEILGFAAGRSGTYTLFKDLSSDTIFSMPEKNQRRTSAKCANWRREAYVVRKIFDDQIEFLDIKNNPLRGYASAVHFLD